LNRFRTIRPGRLHYERALALQERLLEQRSRQDEDFLILLEHFPVITFGRAAGEANLLCSGQELTRRGIDVVRTGRGGDVTYHGPGQLVGYPIVDLNREGRDIHRFLRRLEEVLIRTLAAFNLPGERISGKTGVWVEGEKIASIGIGVRRWISWHGFALNLSGDLSGFRNIIPCGLTGVTMASMEGLLGRSISAGEVQQRLILAFSEVFNSIHAGDYEYDHQEA